MSENRTHPSHQLPVEQEQQQQEQEQAKAKAKE
jgi:hypothetical protein